MSETMYAFTMASGMLALGALFLAMVFRCIDIRSPRLSQLLVFAVLIQGMMIVRFPVLLPLLAPPETELVDRDFARGASLSMISETRDSKFDGDQVIGSAIRPATMTTAESTPLDAASFQSSWGDFLFGFVVPGWACGVVLIALLAIARYLRLCWYVANLSNAPENWQTRWDQLCIECKIKSVPMAVSACAGPMLVRRPSGYTFVVPSDFWETLSANQRESVMLHEIAHIRRHDVWRSLFVRSIALMHWFNPAVWWCVCRFEESSEWAADDFLRGRGRHVSRSLASSLVHLLEFSDRIVGVSKLPSTGMGIQSMAAPPLKNRVNRLLGTTKSQESWMKRASLQVLAFGFVAFAVFQFQVVSAPPNEEYEADDDSYSLRLVADDVKEKLADLKSRLDLADSATSQFADLMDSETGQLAIAGALEQLEARAEIESRMNAVPDFFSDYFESTTGGGLTLAGASQEAVETWFYQAEKLGGHLARLEKTMGDIAERIDGTADADLMAKRMLTDDHSAIVLTMEELDGQIDPIDRFLAEAFREVLVEKGNGLIVIPNLDLERRRQIEMFDRAGQIAKFLGPELAEFSKEFSKDDERHKRFVDAMVNKATVAVIAFHLAEDSDRSAEFAVDEMIDHLEDVSRDTPTGLKIVEEEAWGHIEEIVETSDRASERVEDVQRSLNQWSKKLDQSDPSTAKFAQSIGSGMAAYFVAAEIPYAELDFAELLSERLNEVMEPTSSGRLKVSEGQAEMVLERTGEVLGQCRRVRRFLRKIKSQVDRIEDQELAERFDETQQVVLLLAIRSRLENRGYDVVPMLEDELFEAVSAGSNVLTLRPDRTEVLGDLLERSRELENELSNDDF